MPHSLFIDIPKNFSFRATIYSHGWCELAPFEIDEENWELRYVFQNGKRPINGVISEDSGSLRIDLNAKPANSERIMDDVRHLLRLDDDLSGLYEAVSGNARLNWVTKRKAGRLLRSPTVFEDLVKTICTTNCSWSLTKSMVSNMVEKLGEPAGRDKRAFPTPEAMASVSSDFYRNEIRAGYRSPYFVELAESVVSGKLDPQDWLTSELPTPELKKEMKKVKGVGDYAAENLLKLRGFARSSTKTTIEKNPAPTKRSNGIMRSSASGAGWSFGAI